MKPFLFKIIALIFFAIFTTQLSAQKFQGKAYYFSKSKMELGNWGARMRSLGTETKKIGNYTCYKAAAMVPKSELNWFDFSWSDLRQNSDETQKIEEPMIVIEAWYTPQIPVAQGPAEYWGLPGLILEVSAGNTTLLCSEIILNPKEKVTITAPDKGENITKKGYTSNIRKKMVEMRNNRMGRRSR